MATSGAAVAAAIAQAIKASGMLVKLEPEEFVRLLSRTRDALIVVAEGGFFGKTFQYLMSSRASRFSQNPTAR